MNKINKLINVGFKEGEIAGLWSMSINQIFFVFDIVGDKVYINNLETIFTFEDLLYIVNKFKKSIETNEILDNIK